MSLSYRLLPYCALRDVARMMCKLRWERPGGSLTSSTQGAPHPRWSNRGLLWEGQLGFLQPSPRSWHIPFLSLTLVALCLQHKSD